MPEIKIEQVDGNVTLTIPNVPSFPINGVDLASQVQSIYSDGIYQFAEELYSKLREINGSTSSFFAGYAAREKRDIAIKQLKDIYKKVVVDCAKKLISTNKFREILAQHFAVNLEEIVLSDAMQELVQQEFVALNYREIDISTAVKKTKTDIEVTVDSLRRTENQSGEITISVQNKDEIDRNIKEMWLLVIRELHALANSSREESIIRHYNNITGGSNGTPGLFWHMVTMQLAGCLHALIGKRKLVGEEHVKVAVIQDDDVNSVCNTQCNEYPFNQDDELYDFYKKIYDLLIGNAIGDSVSMVSGMTRRTYNNDIGDSASLVSGMTGRTYNSAAPRRKGISGNQELLQQFLEIVKVINDNQDETATDCDSTEWKKLRKLSLFMNSLDKLITKDASRKSAYAKSKDVVLEFSEREFLAVGADELKRLSILPWDIPKKNRLEKLLLVISEQKIKSRPNQVASSRLQNGISSALQEKENVPDSQKESEIKGMTNTFDVLKARNINPASEAYSVVNQNPNVIGSSSKSLRI